MNKKRSKEEIEEIERQAVEGEQRMRETKQLKIFLIGMGAIIVLIFAGIFIINNMKHFEQNGVTFNVVKEIAPYQTSLPVKYQGKEVPYNFYLRNDPRDLIKEITFEGKADVEVPMNQMVINVTGSDDEFNCDGDGVVGIANVISLHKIIGINTIKDANATCDSEGRYLFVGIEPGNETKIMQTGNACYTIQVNNCEILKATERFMVEMLEEINDKWL